MPTLLEVLQPLFDPLAPGGAWLGENPNDPLPLDVDGQVVPYIVWQDIVTVDNMTLGGASTTQPNRVQVDIFAPRRSDAEAIRKAVDAALVPLNAVQLSRQPIFEPLVKLWRIIRDYSISYDESAT